MNETPLFVIADHYQLARAYARDHGLGPEGRRWRFLREWRQLLGLRSGRFVRVTTGRAPGIVLAEHDALVQHLRMKGFEEIR